MAAHPVLRRTRGHAQTQAEALGGLDGLQHAGQNGLLGDGVQILFAAANPDLFAVQRLAAESLQVGVRVEVGGAGAAYNLPPGLHRQLTAVPAVDLLPGFVIGQFGVHDESVEVEDKGFDHLFFWWLSSIPRARFLPLTIGFILFRRPALALYLPGNTKS